MSAFDLEEQEQLAELKLWWKTNGNLVLTAAIAVLAVVAAWNGWVWYQRNQTAQAAAYYEALQQAARGNDLKTAREAAGSILEKYPRTAYAPLAALISAKLHFQSGDLKTARAQLEWAVEHARNEEVRDIARVRLANVLLDQGAADEALKVLEAKPTPAFEAAFASTRGDILAAQKKTADARAAWQAALDKADPGDSALRETLRLKIDSLGAG